MPSPMHTPIPRRAIVALVVVTGALMAAYLLLRPYGDADGVETSAAADGFASPLWIWSHLAGAAALVTLAALWTLLATGPTRWAAVAGAALVLPYYGAETFALHAIGVGAQSEPELLTLVPEVRDNAVAMTLFGVGLIGLAVSGVAAALGWRRSQLRDQNDERSDGRDAHDWQRNRLANAYLPLAVVAALFLPQFFLPPAGRIAYGVVFVAAAAYAVIVVTRAHTIATGDGPRAVSGAGDIVE